MRAGAQALAPAHSLSLLAAARIAGLLIATTAFFAAFLLRRLLLRDPGQRFRAAARWSRRWAAVCCRIAGYRVTSRGPAPPPGSLVAPNHYGYADILALGSCAPLLFMTKTSIAEAPVVGFLVRVAELVHTSRRKSRDIHDTAGQMRARLQHGASIAIFLEGTSTGGDRVLPFRPSFLQPVIDAGAPVVPVAIQWKPSDPAVSVAEDIAYWKDHEFGSHVFRQLGLRGLAVEITFGPPIPSARMDRKQLADAARREVLALLGRSGEGAD